MLKDSFLKYLLLERNYSKQTVACYGTDITAFEEYFKSVDETLDFTNVDGDLVRSWVLKLMENGYESASVNRKLSSLRAFYRYLLRKGEVTADPTLKVIGPKRKKPLPVFVKEADMNRLLDSTDLGSGFKGVRDRMILEMFYETGMRVSELIGLADADVDFFASTIKVTGKRNKQRLIPFGGELKEDMRNYLSVRDEHCAEGCEAFFVPENGRKMTRAAVYVLVRRNLSKVVTLTKRSPHVLRNYCAPSMMNTHAGRESVIELLCHASLKTTEIYTHTTFEELKKVYEQAHPRA